jgi:hypothetical protein
MNDQTPQESQGAPVSATASPQLPRAIPLIPVKVIDGRPPFAPLATIVLNAIPNRGDLITINVAGRPVVHRVDSVNFDPYDGDAHVTLWCLLAASATEDRQVDPAKWAEFIQQQDQMYQRTEALSKTIIVVGYAGVFAIWGFVKGNLSHRAMVATATLVGFSLIVYVGSEAMAMALRFPVVYHRFNKNLRANPSNPAQAFSDYVEEVRATTARSTSWSRVIMPLVIFTGFAGALILFWNAFADLIGLPQWP